MVRSRRERGKKTTTRSRLFPAWWLVVVTVVVVLLGESAVRAQDASPEDDEDATTIFASTTAGDMNVTNATFELDDHPVTNLTDSDFDRLTQVMIGMTTGDWLVAFCLPSVAPCPWDALTELATELAEIDGNSVNVATVDADENLRLASRFGVATSHRVLFFSHSKMYAMDEDEDLDLESLRGFLNAEDKGDGMKIPRKAGPLKPVHDALSDFFDVVDYRALCIGLLVLAIALVVIGAFMPHEDAAGDKDDDDSADKDDAASKKKTN